MYIFNIYIYICIIYIYIIYIYNVYIIYIYIYIGTQSNEQNDGNRAQPSNSF